MTPHSSARAAKKPSDSETWIGKDGKVGCYLHFYCLNWNTDDLGSDC